MEIRELSPPEIESIKPVFEANGVGLPNPNVSTIVGCVDGSEVKAFLVLQLKLHAEPMWIKEGCSAQFLPLVAEAEKIIKDRVGAAWVYLFAPAGRISELARQMGMSVEPWVVLSKLVTRDMELPPEAQKPIEQAPVGGVQ